MVTINLLPQRQSRSERPCSFAGCYRPYLCKGYCRAHWEQKHRGRPLRAIRAHRAVDVSTGMKVCPACAETKPLSMFSRSSHAKAGVQSWCRECRRKKNYTWSLKANYGISIGDYEALVASQGGECAICGGAFTQRKRTHVDHCHETGRVRGVLCENCNRAIGLLQDRPDIARAAADYLEKAC